MVVSQLYAITTSDKSFQWENNQHKSFNEIKEKIIQALLITFPILPIPFKMEMNASGYAMDVVLMQGGKNVFYDYEKFHGGVLNYPTYEKELYALV
jgi:hypothetical protein